MAVQVIDEAYGTAVRWWDVADHLRIQAAQAGLDSEDPLVRELVYSVSYELRLDHSGGAACALRPQTEAGDVAWPPRIADVPTDVVALWRDLADSVQHPAARARFNDLLFERRDGAGRDRAVTAGTAYLAAARSRKEVDLDVTALLVRTCELGRKVAARQLLDEVYAELIARADDELSSGACAVQKSSLCSHLGYHVIIRRLFGTRGSGRDGAAALDHSCGVDRLAGIV